MDQGGSRRYSSVVKTPFYGPLRRTNTPVAVTADPRLKLHGLAEAQLEPFAYKQNKVLSYDFLSSETQAYREELKFEWAKQYFESIPFD